MVSDVQLENPPCPLCGSAEREVTYADFGGYKLVRCRACGLHYLFPRPTEACMREAYSTGEYFEGSACGYSEMGYSSQERALRATFQRLLQNMQKRGLIGGQLLEIGCGYGYLLDEARKFFEYRAGTDFSAEAAARASTVADRVYTGGIEQVAAERQFDCVIATQVVEHVYQPVSFVRELIQRTKPGGHILLATPDIGGILRRSMGRSWPSFKIPEHVVYFDESTLTRLMATAGLVGVRALPYPHAFPLGLLLSKFHLRAPAFLAELNVWVPATTVAMCGTVAAR